jgi:hypothetical protein
MLKPSWLEISGGIAISGWLVGSCMAIYPNPNIAKAKANLVVQYSWRLAISGSRYC